MEQKKYSIDDLCQLVNLPKRTIRYYIQLGLVDRPLGETKGAHYVAGHLDQLLRVKKLTEARVPLEQIRKLIDGVEDGPVVTSERRPGTVEVKSHLYIAPGVELQISSEQARLRPEQIRALLREVMLVTKKIMDDEVNQS